MQKKQNMTMGKSKKARKHSIGQRLVAGLLCICLSLLSLPIDDYGNFVLAAEGREFVMFAGISYNISAFFSKNKLQKHNFIVRFHI